MLVYTFHTQKGGVGKTVNTGNVAHGLSLRGFRVCMIDADTQGNLTTWMAGDKGEYELSDYLDGDCSLNDAIIPIHENLDLIGTAERNSTLFAWTSNKYRENPYVFRELARELKQKRYDVLFFDLSPTFSEYQKCIYLALDQVIGSTMPGESESAGVVAIRDFLDEIKEDYGREIFYQKIVLNRINNAVSGDKETRAMLEKMEEESNWFFVYPIGTNTTIPEAIAKSRKDNKPGLTIYSMKKSNTPKAISDYGPLVDDLTKELLKNKA